jgi:beta-galactosidase
MIRVWDYSDVAHGADALNYFLFREAPYGAEHAQVGVVGWDNYRSERYQVITQTASELRRLSNLLQGSRVVSPVALLISPDTRWSLEFEKPGWPTDEHNDFDYTRQLVNFYAGFRRVAVNVDVVFPQQDLSRYKILVAPCLRVVDTPLAHKLDGFVKSGGTLLLSYLSGSRDERNWNTELTLPGLLREMTGASIHDFEPQSGQEQEIAETSGARYPAVSWFDILEPTTATTLATYTKKFYAGKAAVTRNLYGRGTVYYIGTEVSSPAFYQQFVNSALQHAGVAFGPTVPHGIQLATREKPGTTIIFALNYSDQPQTVSMGHAYRNALTSEMEPAELVVPAYDVKILISTATGGI